MGWYIEQLIVTMLGLLILVANILVLAANMSLRKDMDRMWTSMLQLLGKV